MGDKAIVRSDVNPFWKAESREWRNYQFCNLGRTKTTVPKGDTNENLTSLIEAQKDSEQRHQGLFKGEAEVGSCDKICITITAMALT